MRKLSVLLVRRDTSHVSFVIDDFETINMLHFHGSLPSAYTSRANFVDFHVTLAFII